MWQGDMPSEAQNSFTNLERNYNPWGVGWASRAQWLEERGVRDLVNLLPEDHQEFEYLLYGGCAVAFDDRYKKVGEALIKILHQAEVKFGYLGTEEQCCGDPARRLGNEYLYQTLAAHNIETFNNYGVKKIICLCPHGFNTIKNEYPQMDGNYEVYHYTEILQKLLAEGKLRPNQPTPVRLSYHDSCFLGRHNGIYAAPREILAAAGSDIMPLDKSKQFGFCCGAGGGRMFLEEEAAEGFKRINETRTDQLLEGDPEMIATNCPFCLTMITDGIKTAEQDESVKVMDVAEILLSRMQ
jgi:Fe-S oxidoreductase